MWSKIGRYLTGPVAVTGVGGLLSEALSAAKGGGERPAATADDSKSALRPGNVIRISRGLYHHYGVYVGSAQVIHFTGETVADAAIVQTSLRTFVDWEAYELALASYENDKPMLPMSVMMVGGALLAREKPHPPEVEVMAFSQQATAGISLEECVRRARSKIGCSDYGLLDNNCEHFAVWCRTNVAESAQAFGSRSKHFGPALGAAVTDLWAELMSSVGMSVSRTVEVT